MKTLIAALFVSASLSLNAYAQPSASAAPSTEAKAVEKPKKQAVFRPTKDQIMEVQNILKTKKLYAGDATGKYNSDTRAGIKSFQNENGLKDTGTLNRATLEKFGVTLTDSQKLIPVSESSFAKVETKSAEREPNTGTKNPAAAPALDKPKKPAPFRATKEQIAETQKLLKAKNMYAGEETGKLDDATREGLKKYQEANGLKVTGTLNAVTLEKMGIALTDAQKANVAAQTAYDAANQKN
jgi:peptidoglycan hydrolase-like protein with peptidoglycan-binding domain